MYLHVHTLDDLHVDLNLLAKLEQLPGCIWHCTTQTEYKNNGEFCKKKAMIICILRKPNIFDFCFFLMSAARWWEWKEPLEEVHAFLLSSYFAPNSSFNFVLEFKTFKNLSNPHLIWRSACTEFFLAIGWEMWACCLLKKSSKQQINWYFKPFRRARAAISM